jgi:hypothetical protein
MAGHVLRDCFVEINGVDLSNNFSQFEINKQTDVVDVTGFGAKSKEKALGIPDDSMTGTAFQDFDAGSVNATLAPLVGSDEPFDVVVRPTSAAKSPTNPEYTMEAILPNFKPLSGAVGAASTVDLTFENAGAEGVQEATA